MNVFVRYDEIDILVNESLPFIGGTCRQQEHGRTLEQRRKVTGSNSQASRCGHLAFRFSKKQWHTMKLAIVEPI